MKQNKLLLFTLVFTFTSLCASFGWILRQHGTILAMNHLVDQQGAAAWRGALVEAHDSSQALALINQPDVAGAQKFLQHRLQSKVVLLEAHRKEMGPNEQGLLDSVQSVLKKNSSSGDSASTAAANPAEKK
jgi:hypothetical protein